MSKVLNDLFDYKNLKIFQGKENFKFSLDSLLLAEFIKINLSTKKVVDFCTGNAPIPLIISKNKKLEIIGIEIQKEVADLAKESVLINKIENIEIITDSIKDVNKYISNESVDIVSCNPPYFKVDNDSFINENVSKSISRHEININIETIIKKAYEILKTNGKFYLVHRADRLEEIITDLNTNYFEVKRLQFVYSKKGKDAIIVLIEASKRGKQGLKVCSPVFLDEFSSYKHIFK